MLKAMYTGCAHLTVTSHIELAGDKLMVKREKSGCATRKHQCEEKDTLVLG